MKTTLEEIYSLSVKIYYEVADDKMKKRGHPGVSGEADMNIGKLIGTIETLKQVLDKIKNTDY